MAKPNIGLRQARRLAQMSPSERMTFISEGLPIVLQSARGFLQASKALENHPREAEVLEAYAEEEAAKALVLLDIVRCPSKLAASHLGKMIGWFYSHLARMVYAEACHWKPMHVTQLQEYANNELRTHYIDGDYGEYIFPNSHLFARESKLYADIGAYENDEIFWNVPEGSKHRYFRLDPVSLEVVEALSAVGALSTDGLKIVANVWGREPFGGTMGYAEDRALKQQMLERLIENALPLEHAAQSAVSQIYEGWQFPMYSLELREIEVSMEELEAEREAQLPYAI